MILVSIFGTSSFPCTARDAVPITQQSMQNSNETMCLAFRQAVSYFPQRKVAGRALGSQIGLSGHLPRHPTNSLFYVMLGKSSNVSIYFMLPLISTCLLPCHYTALPMMLLYIPSHTINHARGLTRIAKTTEMSIENLSTHPHHTEAYSFKGFKSK